jgi:glucose dehydrogenase
MSQELSISASLAFSKSGISSSMQSGTLKFTVSGGDYQRATMSVPTSATVLPLGSIGTAGYCIVVNRDATNYVEVYTGTSGVAAIKLKPGEWAMFRFAVAAPAVKSNTAACVIEYLVIED